MKFRRGLVRTARLHGGTPVRRREKRHGRAVDRHRQVVRPGVSGKKGERLRLELRQIGQRQFPGQDLPARPHGRGDVGGERMLAAVAGQRDGAVKAPGEGVGEGRQFSTGQRFISREAPGWMRMKFSRAGGSERK